LKITVSSLQIKQSGLHRKFEELGSSQFAFQICYRPDQICLSSAFASSGDRLCAQRGYNEFPMEDIMAEKYPAKDKAPPKIVCARIAGSEKAVRAFLAKHPIEPQATKREGDIVSLDVFVEEHVVADIDEKDLKVKVLFDASARGRERQKEVGKGNRFLGAQRIPLGLGIKTREEPQ
jgi:hypothetical protein